MFIKHAQIAFCSKLKQPNCHKIWKKVIRKRNLQKTSPKNKHLSIETSPKTSKPQLHKKQAQIRGKTARLATLYRNLKWISILPILPCNCCVIKPNSRTIRSQISATCLCKQGADSSELQFHQCMTPKQWTWLLYSVSRPIVPANKLPLQELSE